MIFTWNIPASDGGLPQEEMLVAFDRDRGTRVLVLPAWFDEANKLRRFTIEVMRRLDSAGIDSLLPDFAGCNESLAPLNEQTVEGWRSQSEAAAESLGATHVLAIRAGALIAPRGLPGWHYAALSGPKLLRALLRARTIAAREAGRFESAEGLMAQGKTEGLVLGGWRLGPELITALETAEPTLGPRQQAIPQTALGAPGLWLRAEPDDDAAQSHALAAIIAGNVTA